MIDTSFDTNPEQQRETVGNRRCADSAYLCEFCNYQQQLELYRNRLLISRFQVRVLGGSLLKALQIAGKQTPLVRYQGRFKGSYLIQKDLVKGRFSASPLLRGPSGRHALQPGRYRFSLPTRRSLRRAALLQQG